jgi:hypothetical protein
MNAPDRQARMPMNNKFTETISMTPDGMARTRAWLKFVGVHGVVPRNTSEQAEVDRILKLLDELERLKRA